MTVLTDTRKRGRVVLSRLLAGDERTTTTRLSAAGEVNNVILRNRIHDEPGTKKQRITKQQGSASGTKRFKRVTFARRLVDQVIEIPYLTTLLHQHHHKNDASSSRKEDDSNEEDTNYNNSKHELFYSAQDFERFFRNEQRRRNALILTVTVGREQQQRLLLGTPLLSPTTIHQMYYKVLSRQMVRCNTINCAPPLSSLSSNSPQADDAIPTLTTKVQHQSKRTQWELCYNNSTHPNSVSARCA